MTSHTFRAWVLRRVRPRLSPSAPARSESLAGAFVFLPLGAMFEAYSPVEAGLGLEENFLSLADILMSQERLPCRAETNLPRLGAVLGKAALAPASSADAAVPEVRRRPMGTGTTAPGSPRVGKGGY